VTRRPVRLVIFDCDGVLIDSEPLSKALVAEEAASLGWQMSETELHGLTGLTWSALRPVFEARLGMTLQAGWASKMQARLIPMLQQGVSAMPGAHDVLLATKGLGLPYRIASNSSHEEMQQKLAATGLLPLVQGRVHSARDVARGKPAPDLFLATAAAEGVAPEACLVVEDSVPGIAAAHAAGMQVIAYAPETFAANAHAIQPHAVVTSLAALVPIFQAALVELAG
jgi:HAD superfamily hydrolase (TIGR01509 family)